MSNYKPGTNKECLPCVEGRGVGLGYYAHTLYPELTCNSDEEAERAAKIANIAYKEGYEMAKQELRQFLGIK